MAPWRTMDPSEYLSLDLRAHDILSEVPIHDVCCLDLPCGGEGRTVENIRKLATELRHSRVVRLLFSFRRVLGQIFRWDQIFKYDDQLFQNGLTKVDRELSLVPPGEKDGPFTILYVHQKEAVSEVRNRTVHAALVWALIRRKGGYRLFWAIYVKSVSWFTSIYMFFIDPFRKLFVYPSILNSLYRLWCKKFATGSNSHTTSTAR